MLYIVKVPSIKVTESETSFIKGKQNSNQFKLRSFHSCLPQILLGPSLNTFPQIISPLLTHFRSTFPFYTPRWANGLNSRKHFSFRTTQSSLLIPPYGGIKSSLLIPPINTTIIAYEYHHKYY